MLRFTVLSFFLTFFIYSAVMEFVCDLTYNITMSRIHASVQGLVFQSVMRQDITFFDNNKPGLLFIGFLQDLGSKLTVYFGTQLSHCHTFSPSLLLLGELVSHVTTNTNTMSEALSEELSLVMWYTGRLAFLLFFMVSQSWKLTLLSCMSLPIIWVVTKVFGYISQVKHASLPSSRGVSVSALPLLDNVHDYFHVCLSVHFQGGFTVFSQGQPGGHGDFLLHKDRQVFCQ